MGPQPKVIAAALLQAKRPLATVDIQKAVESSVKTRQPIARVVSFYMTRWRNLGLVKRV